MPSVYNEEKKLVFIHVHKCAGHAIFKSLLQAEEKQNINSPTIKPHSKWNDITNVSDINNIMNENNSALLANFNNPIHARALDMQNYLHRDKYIEYYSFACVRNPWNRLFSWYRYLKKNTNKGQHDVIKYWELEEFIHYSVDHFYLPQSDWVTNGSDEIIVDNLIRFENLANDWSTLTEDKLNTKVELPVVNKSIDKEDMKIFSRVRKTTLKKFRDNYAKDFELLGYSSDLPPCLEDNDALAPYDAALALEFDNKINYNNDKSKISEDKLELYKMFNSAQNYSNYILGKLNDKSKQYNHFKEKLQRSEAVSNERKKQIEELKSVFKDKLQRSEAVSSNRKKQLEELKLKLKQKQPNKSP